MKQFWERYGKMVGTFFAGAVLIAIAWGFFTDWNFTSNKVMASASKPKNIIPKDGDSCTTPDGKSGTLKGGVCTA